MRGGEMPKILVVEDERIVAEDVRRSLLNMGYSVPAIVSSGEEALTIAKEETPDLVLMDIVLKGDMDGIEAAEHIYSHYNIPVVYLTAYADEKKLQRAKVTEPYGYMLKPFEDKELHTTIEMALYKHKMEKKVRKSEKWLHTIIRSIGEGVIVTDSKGFITFMNPVAEVVTGHKQDEAVGNPLENILYIIDEKTNIHYDNIFEKTVNGVVNLPKSAVLIARDGTERIIEDNSSPIYGDNNTILGAVFAFRDVTEKRKMEENFRTMEREKMESLATLAGGIAHDFNNILTVVLSDLALARMKLTHEDEISGKLAEAEKTLLNARKLTHKLYTFSREGVPSRKPVSLSDLLRSASEHALKETTCTCEFVIQEGLQSVDIDPEQIGQVIYNLVTNADQAMPDGGIITICAENVSVSQDNCVPLTEGDYVLVHVKDQGVGILEGHLKKIFDPYFTTKQRGSGLGLATSYSIIKNHGGHISVESKIGEGTTFYVWLPASEKNEGSSRFSSGNERSLVNGQNPIEDHELMELYTYDG